MRRADRLLSLMEALRSRRLITGRQIAALLEVSLRTVYRDIAALVRIGIPVRGEAGVGYSLEPGYYLPPVNLTPEEAEMLDLAARIFQSVSDPGAALRVASAIAKVRAVLPRDAQVAVHRNFFVVPESARPQAPKVELLELRRAVESRRELEIDYVRSNGTRFITTVRPLSLCFVGTWFVIVWSEDEGQFRRLRVDRIDASKPTGRIFRSEHGKRLEDWGGTAPRTH